MMGLVTNTPHWLYDALAVDPKPEPPPPPHWSIRIAPFIVAGVIGLLLGAIYLAFKGVPL